jgi:hypothetical protein
MHRRVVGPQHASDARRFVFALDASADRLRLNARRGGARAQRYLSSVPPLDVCGPWAERRPVEGCRRADPVLEAAIANLLHRGAPGLKPPAPAAGLPPCRVTLPTPPPSRSTPFRRGAGGGAAAGGAQPARRIRGRGGRIGDLDAMAQHALTDR